MLHLPFVIVVALIAAGCAIATEPQALVYGDYVAFSCSDLAQETKRLVREKASRSEHLLEDDAARRQRATTQIADVKRAAAEKRC